MAGALDGLVVIDRSDTIAGQYCGKLLADFGATVWLGEAPAHDGAAPLHDLAAGARDGDRALDLHLNLLKRRGAPDSADVVLCAPGEDPAGVHDTMTGSIAVSITGFGTDGPRSGWAAPEIVLQAASGMMISNGVRGREPLYGIGERASFAAGLAAYVQILVSLRVRSRTGQGDTVRVDAAECAATMCFPYALQAIYNGTDRRRGDQSIPAGEVLCQGAWVCLWVYSNRFRDLCVAFGLEACLDDPRFADAAVRGQNWPAFFALFQEKVGDHDPDALVARLQAMNVIAARAFRVGEIRASRHLHARGYWRNARIAGEDVVLPGVPWRMSATPARPVEV